MKRFQISIPDKAWQELTQGYANIFEEGEDADIIQELFYAEFGRITVDIRNSVLVDEMEEVAE